MSASVTVWPECAGVELYLRDGVLLVSCRDFSTFLDADQNNLLRYLIFGHPSFKTPTLDFSEKGFLQVDLTFCDIKLTSMNVLLLCVVKRTAVPYEGLEELPLAAQQLGVFDMLREQLADAQERKLCEACEERASANAATPLDDVTHHYDWLVSPPTYASSIFMQYDSIKLAEEGYALVHSNILANGLIQVYYRRKAR